MIYISIKLPNKLLVEVVGVLVVELLKVVVDLNADGPEELT